MPPTQTVSSDDARRFRGSASVPLMWEEAVPSPPIDRIEFTRRILQAARKAGFDVSAWNTSIADKDPEKRFEAFQKDIANFVPKQFFKGVPTVHFSIWNEGFHSSCIRTMTWSEYIEQLEYEYFGPWERAWKFGASLSSRQNLRDWLLTFLAYRSEYSEDGICVGQTAYSNAINLTGNESLSNYLHLHDGNDLMMEIKGQIGVEIPIIAERRLGLSVEMVMFLPIAAGLLCIGGAVYGVVTHHFSAWWLLLIIPLTCILTVCGRTSLFSIPRSRHWQNKQLTFNEIFDQIIAAKKRDWAELQHVYKEN